MYLGFVALIALHNNSPRCRTKNFGMIYIILGSFYSFLNWEGVDIWPQIRPRQISDEA